ncbi:MAG: DUF4252 domain-containing protein [Lacinutrix sp.]|uniref:DUF4252 domain-containing protein n=1 Tax=Lacinutrix sp. TaxID=1937692 RepID=UPI0030A0A1FD
MKPIFKTIVFTLLIAVALVSCKDESSIENYFVDHQDKPEFLTIDFAPDMLDISEVDFSEDQKKIYKSYDKVNALAFKVTENNKEEYKAELKKAIAIFKNDKYEELIEFTDSGINFRVNTLGEADTVDEFLVLASTSELGFALIRVLGDDMQPEKLYELIFKIQKTDVYGNQLQKVMDYLKE